MIEKWVIFFNKGFACLGWSDLIGQEDVHWAPKMVGKPQPYLVLGRKEFTLVNSFGV